MGSSNTELFTNGGFYLVIIMISITQGKYIVNL